MTESDTWLDRVRSGRHIQMPDWGFLDAVFAARRITDKFNTTPVDQMDQRVDLLKSIFGKFGAESWVESGLAVDVGVTTEIGERVFININCTLIDTFPITIGNDVLIGPNCLLSAATHPVEYRQRIVVDPATGKPTGGITTGAPIVLEDGVWLGGMVCVLPGVTIGARSVIGAGSVVTRSIPPDVVAAGNPCRVLRQINQA